jgi:hypothetical protein
VHNSAGSAAIRRLIERDAASIDAIDVHLDTALAQAAEPALDEAGVV